jgi:hypothetical protein
MTVGNYILAYGLTDEVMIGTSPWLQFSYNSDNLVLRLKHPLDSESSIGQQLIYLQNDTSFGSVYEMTAFLYWLTWSKKMTTFYNLNISLNTMYFWDEKIPFSLRREPYNTEVYQFSLSTLHQLSVTEKIMAQFELGVLGLNYRLPYFQLGSSFVYLEKNYSIQVGASVSLMPPYETPYIPIGNTNRIGLTGENLDTLSLHPEVQLQYWF